jgi:DNA-binding response OmpR family regulator
MPECTRRASAFVQAGAVQLLPEDRYWLLEHLGSRGEATNEQALLDEIQTSQLPVAAFDPERRRLLVTSATGRSVQGFDGLDLEALDVIEMASDPDAALRLHGLISHGYLAEWKYRCWLRTPDGERQRGVAYGRAVSTGKNRRVVVASFAPEAIPRGDLGRPLVVSAPPVPVLIAHDDNGIRARIRRALVEGQMQVDDVSNWAAVLVATRRLERFVLVVGAGLAGTADLARLVNANHSGVCGVVIVVSDFDERLGPSALDAGFDDYVREGSIEYELPARVRLLARRAVPPVSRSLDFGDLVIDLAAREVRQHGRAVALTAREFDLLAFLASTPHVAFSREELLQQVWQSSPDWQSVATVTEHVRRIRDKLESDGEHSWLRTIRGSGYIFRP